MAHLHNLILRPLYFLTVGGLLAGGTMMIMGDVSKRWLASLLIGLGAIAGAASFAGFFLPDVQGSVVEYASGNRWGGTV